jgi:hypothetical protein
MPTICTDDGRRTNWSEPFTFEKASFSILRWRNRNSQFTISWDFRIRDHHHKLTIAQMKKLCDVFLEGDGWRLSAFLNASAVLQVTCMRTKHQFDRWVFQLVFVGSNGSFAFFWCRDILWPLKRQPFLWPLLLICRSPGNVSATGGLFALPLVSFRRKTNWSIFINVV